MSAEYYTPNFASDANRIAPILAKKDVACAIYFWLHSRAFVAHNYICVSKSKLAEILGCSRSTVQRAIKFLVDSGLVEEEPYRGNGGTSYFRLIGLNAACTQHLPGKDCSAAAASNAASMYSNAAAVQRQMSQPCSTIKTERYKDGGKRKSRSPYDY